MPITDSDHELLYEPGAEQRCTVTHTPLPLYNNTLNAKTSSVPVSERSDSFRDIVG